MSRSDSPADSDDEGHSERFMPLVDAAAAPGGRDSGPYGSGSGGEGDESSEDVRRMVRAFGLFEPDEEQTITADNVCALFRRLGHRADSARVAALFADLNRRIAAGTAVDAHGSGPAADDSEMHLRAFIRLMRQRKSADAAASSAALANLGSSSGDESDAETALTLDRDLSDLLRSFERMASGSAGLGKSAAASDSASGLLDVRVLRHRMGLARNAKLSDAELAALIDFAGVVGAKAAPTPHDHSHVHPNPAAVASAHPHSDFIDYRSLVRNMAANTPTSSKGI